jgi:hypothetical protein
VIKGSGRRNVELSKEDAAAKALLLANCLEAGESEDAYFHCLDLMASLRAQRANHLTTLLQLDSLEPEEARPAGTTKSSALRTRN